MRLLLAALPLILVSCAPFTDALTPAYMPAPIRIADSARYQADVAECQAAGMAYQPPDSLRGAIVETVRGATANSSMIPLSPLVPVYGALGGAVGAVNDGFDLASRQHANVFRNCLIEETRRDGSAVLADPRD